MKRVLVVVAILAVLIGLGAWISQQNKTPAAPAQTATSSQSATGSSGSRALPAPNQGAGGVYDNTTPGNAAQCARCDQYQGAQKAQCLAALNC